ncbi:hypothetical protein MLD38_002814 [Melastoma candidum]|uniref:Uncharacterized protein n=1 Tax=Melastoma candidum TaxID=119954 RepID=A0ACB9S168_9MYRT|nr:hypothetical protein MLD38_002814 [Melastoma candidum]
MPETQKKHVAVLPFPFGTHAAPLLSIVRRLSSSSSAPAIFSFFCTPNTNASLFGSSLPLGDVTPYEVWDGVSPGYTFSGKHQEDIELFIQAAPYSFAEGMRAAEAKTGRKITCIISDAFLWFAADMARDLDVPWLAFWTAGPAALTAHLHTDLLREKLLGDRGVVGREDETLGFIPGMSKTSVRDLQEGVVFGNMESKFSKMLHEMGKALPRATAVFINCFEELDPIITADLKSKLKEYLNIGPINMMGTQVEATVPDKTGCLEWLDGQREASVVYVSFGTVMVPPAKELEELAGALEESGAPFIWSLKEKVWGSLPVGFLERTEGRGKVVGWAPQVGILRHPSVGAFVTHCGWNSVLESIVGGRAPMICRPFFGDQRLNARMMEVVWGMGAGMEGGVISKKRLLSCLGEIGLVSDGGGKGREMRDNLLSLRRRAQSSVSTDGTSSANFRSLLTLALS